MSLLILLSNDDGIGSEGLIALKEELSRTDEVWAIAPERERTCVGHAITLHKPLRIKEHGERLFSTNGTPADAILLGVKGLLQRKPDLVISGINKGPNMGQDVTYSGTVAAAKEAAFMDIPSLAVSLNGRKDFLFKEAVRTVREIVEKMRARPLPEQTLLNVNIPNLPKESVRGFKMTRLGKRIYNGKVVERIDPRGGKYYWISGDSDRFEPIEGTDLLAVSQGYISVTPLHRDMATDVAMESFKKMF
ncbi:MAG TPA: 5'/3'-nucleotidase SurE [Syntrophorhabdales bacterium]|nr:5'/3'-nucleotidase SurE [Syntrophorhabdales bacterium]